MVLNLLAGSKVTSHGNESGSRSGRNLEEARKLVEQSFGNYVSSNVMIAAKEELTKMEREIQVLTSEVSDKAIDNKARKILSAAAYKEIADLQEELRAEKRKRSEIRKLIEVKRMSGLKPLLEEFENGQLPFVCLQYKDSESVLHSIPAVYLGKVESLEPVASERSLYVALGSDNSWYLFTEKWIRTVYRTGLPNIALARGNALPREIMMDLLESNGVQWEKLADSEFGSLWSKEGSLDTWSWSLNVPVLNSLSDKDEAMFMSPEFHEQWNGTRNRGTRLPDSRRRSPEPKGSESIKDHGLNQVYRREDQTDEIEATAVDQQNRTDRSVGVEGVFKYQQRGTRDEQWTSTPTLYTLWERRRLRYEERTSCGSP